MSTQSWYAINAQKQADEAEVMIYDVIGAWGINAQQFVSAFKAIDAKTINVRINSPGGEVIEATAIYNAIREHPARVVVWVDGAAASAGSFIAMSGDEIRMADNSYMMIHEARGGVMGEADDMRKYADVLEKMNDNIAAMYQKKAGKSRKYWREKMAEESWFTAEEAKAEGLADRVVEATKQEKGARAEFDFKIYNQAKIPDAVKAMWGIQESTTQPAPELSRESEPAQANTKEIQPMAETLTQTAPAQNSAAVAVPNSQQSNTPQQEIGRLTNDAITRFTEGGKVIGRTEGRNSLMDEIRAIVAACPGRPQTAINAILAGQNASTVKLIVDAELAAETRANQKAQEQELAIARLQADNARLAELGSVGGHSGVPMSASVYAPGANAQPQAPSGLEPEAQAKLEWDSDPMLRARNNNQEKAWMAFRVNQLKGNVRILAKTA